MDEWCECIAKLWTLIVLSDGITCNICRMLEWTSSVAIHIIVLLFALMFLYHGAEMLLWVLVPVCDDTFIGVNGKHKNGVSIVFQNVDFLHNVSWYS